MSGERNLSAIIGIGSLKSLESLSHQNKQSFDSLLRLVSDSLALAVTDLWEQSEAVASYWLCVVSGLHQPRERDIASSLLTWKAFVSRDSSQVRCIATSDRREYICCQTHFRHPSTPYVAFSDAKHFGVCTIIGTEILVALSAIDGALHRFFTRIHQLIENSKSIREIHSEIGSPGFWASIDVDPHAFTVLAKVALFGIWPAFADIGASTDMTAKWQLGEYELLAGLVARESPEVSELVLRVTQALGSGPGDILKASYSSGFRTVASAAYDTVRCLTSISYDFEPVNHGDGNQIVRLAGKVLRENVGTCLDLALMFAAILEGSQLAPVLIVARTGNSTHAISGFCDDASEDRIPHVTMDVAAIRAFVDGGKVIPIESTGLSISRGKKLDYSDACRLGREIIEGADELAMVNVIAARYLNTNRTFSESEA